MLEISQLLIDGVCQTALGQTERECVGRPYLVTVERFSLVHNTGSGRPTVGNVQDGANLMLQPSGYFVLLVERN